MRKNFYSSSAQPLSKAKARLTALAAAMLLAPAAWAQAPANDDCAAAVALTPGATCTATNGTVIGATQSIAPIACAGFTSPAANDVWYSFTATATAHTITATSTFDGVLEVLGGACGATTSLGCADATTSGAESVTLNTLTVGTTYRVRYYAYGNTAPANGAFTICVTAAAPALANDNPSGAIVLPIGTTCTPVNGTNVGATVTTPVGYTNPPTPTSCAIAVNPRDVWYRFTTAASGPGSTAVTIRVTGAPAGSLRLFSSTGGAAGPFTEVACASGGANNTVSAPLDARTLTPNTTYYVMVSGYGSADTQGAFTICAVAPPANDAAVTSIYTLGKVSTFSSPVSVQAVIRNEGTAAITNRTVNLNVTGATTFSNQQTIASLAPGASTTVTFAGYPVTATSGNNTVLVSLASDDNAANNTMTFGQAISSGQMSYIDPSQPITASVGVSSTTPQGILAVRYTVGQATPLREVRLSFLANATTTSTYQVVVLNAAANGTPGTIVFTSPTLNRPTAATTVTVPVTNVSVNGTFYLGIREISGNVGIGYQVEDPLRPATFYFQGGGTTTWNDVNTTTLKTRLAIEASFQVTSSKRDAALASAIEVYPNPASQTFTLSLPALAGERTAEITLLNSLGQEVQKQVLSLNAAGTQSPVDVSKLAAGLYTVRVQAGDQMATKQIMVK